eukprot:145324-Rhodomonas_salina.1
MLRAVTGWCYTLILYDATRFHCTVLRADFVRRGGRGGGGGVEVGGGGGGRGGVGSGGYRNRHGRYNNSAQTQGEEQAQLLRRRRWKGNLRRLVGTLS